MLLVQRGKELGYTLTDEQFKNIIENIKKENKIESEEAFQAALKQENMTMAELQALVGTAVDGVAGDPRTRSPPSSRSPRKRCAGTTRRT